jgi:chromosome partitioning protein
MAYGLAALGKKVLAVDLDSQGNLTMAMGMRGEFDATQNTTWMLTHEASPTPRAVRENLYLIPADISLARTEMGLLGPTFQFLLKNALTRLLSPEFGFDYILIDAPPNLNLLTINALVAADLVIVPLTCDGYAMSGIADLTRTITTLQQLNPSLSLGGVVACRFSRQRVIDRQMVAEMERAFGPLLFKAKVPESTALKECGPLGKSIWDYAPSSLAAPIMAELCQELLEKVEHVEA